MKRLLNRSLLALPLLVAGVAKADLNPAMVGADAQWVVYVDFQTLRGSPLGQELIKLANQNQPVSNDVPVQVNFEKVLAAIGSVTAYGSNLTNDPKLLDGTLVCQGSPELRKIAEGFIAQAELSGSVPLDRLKDLPFEAYQIDKELVVALPSEPLVLLSKNKAQLVKAHALVQGKGDSLAKAKASPLTALLKGPRAKSYLVAVSVMPDEKVFPDKGPHARILQMANSAAVHIGDHDGNTHARVQLSATSDEMAERLMRIVQGLTAMMSMTETSDQHLAEFMKSVKVERKVNTVALELAYSTDRLVGMLQNSLKERKVHVRATPKPPTAPGKVVAEWTADAVPADSATTVTMATKVIENVALKPGSTVTVTGHVDEGELARIDFIEIEGSGLPALKFEAEHLRLVRYQTETTPSASGGRVARLVGGGRAGTIQLHFPGVEGNYTVRVRYLDENDGKCRFALAVAPVTTPTSGN